MISDLVAKGFVGMMRGLGHSMAATYGGNPGYGQREAVMFEARVDALPARFLSEAQVAIELKLHEDPPPERKVTSARAEATIGSMNGGMQTADDLVAALARFQSSCEKFWRADDEYDERADAETDHSPVQKLKVDLIDAAEDARTAAEMMRFGYVRDVPVLVPVDPYSGPTTPVAEHWLNSDLFRLAYSEGNPPARSHIQTFLHEAIARARRWRPESGGGGAATQPAARGTKIVIGHGGSLVWLKLEKFIKEKLGLEVVEFNSDPVPGFTHKERLLQMKEVGGFAFLVMTAEDEQADRTVRARQNVVHEAGFFQASFGFERAIVLLEQDCTLFSNADGINHLPFPKGNILSVSQEIRDVLTRERFLK